ncbi:hypothetical protein H0X48_03195 [Candidatus Dependentiae bacterium]|nr:hypothetical protein [Candidatus Dependentiae bacterium]
MIKKYSALALFAFGSLYAGGNITDVISSTNNHTPISKLDLISAVSVANLSKINDLLASGLDLKELESYLFSVIIDKCIHVFKTPLDTIIVALECLSDKGLQIDKCLLPHGCIFIIHEILLKASEGKKTKLCHDLLTSLLANVNNRLFYCVLQKTNPNLIHQILNVALSVGYLKSVILLCSLLDSKAYSTLFANTLLNQTPIPNKTRIFIINVLNKNLDYALSEYSSQQNRRKQYKKYLEHNRATLTKILKWSERLNDSNLVQHIVELSLPSKPLYIQKMPELVNQINLDCVILGI